ncbi:YmfK family protein [Staphylococcus aureus]|uniref:YmfK family protein n=1 Tax=Staphylococcus aureus TaxID=1280 RepID=UPI001F1EE952|nr:YmfK family protein [Staphylococcus aureus]MCF8746839.1 YmfK family protein [Staphylococcus aureus]HDB1465592.1 YmfK family protein [Staphylococcus aureus]HDD7032118.1 YmfK family protein [Staphylococcus aureus]
MTVAEKKEWYLEYEIEINRPGLLGDVSSLLGMLGISIVTINGVDQGKRGLLIKTDNLEKVERFEQIARGINEIEITKLKKPELRDRLAVRHGRYIEQDAKDKKTFGFEREDLGLLVDFLAELFKEEGHKLIGIRGMPRVGKTESIVAGSVCAHKRWLFISSTLIKQTVRSSLIKGEYDANHVYIIDGAVTARESNPKHQELVNEVMTLPSIKVVEHPDLFVETSTCTMEDFDYIIELRENENQEIHYEEMKKQTVQSKNNLDFGDPFGGGFGFFE